MGRNGVLEGLRKDTRTVRVRSLDPYSSEFTAGQIGVLADIAERFGSGRVHVTPRQTVEIPHILCDDLLEVTALLEEVGLAPGSSGTHLRNVIACSRWCLYNAVPLSDLARRINNIHAERELPGKTNISLSGCDFSCVRSRTSDIGVISRTGVEITDKECKKCSLCIKEPLGCQVDAIRLTDAGVILDTQRCVSCGFCTNICRPGTLKAKFRAFDIFLGGCGGLKPREAVLYKRVVTEEDVVKEIDSILSRYVETGRNGERLGALIERIGLENFHG